MKVAIYSRKSVFTGKGESIENQIQLCTDYINSHYSISKDDIYIYQDEGYSGSNINRPMFKKLIEDANSKKFDCLICYRLDRISRNVSDFSTLIERLNKLDISFISIKSAKILTSICFPYFSSSIFSSSFLILTRTAL